MKKLILLMTAFFLISGVSYAEFGKGKKKKCAKGKSCCAKKAEGTAAAGDASAEKKSCGEKTSGKACCKSKSTTVQM